MITNVILIVFYSVMSFIVGLFPSWGGWPESMETVLTTIGQNLGTLNKLIPVDQILIILTLMLTMEFGYKTAQLINWILNKLRGSG